MLNSMIRDGSFFKDQVMHKDTMNYLLGDIKLGETGPKIRVSEENIRL